MKQKVTFQCNSVTVEQRLNKRGRPRSVDSNLIDHIKDYVEYFPRGKESTKARNARKLRKFCHWTGKTPQQLIKEYEDAKERNDLEAWERDVINDILKFYTWLTEQINSETGKKYSLNYCRTEPIGILAFHRQNTRQLPDVTKNFAPPQLPTDEYRFTQDDLRKMFYYGDTEEKALLSLAVSYGQGSKEFLSLECQTFKELIQEAKDKNKDFMVWIGEARAKTSIQPRSFLTPEAIESLDEYLNLLEKKFGALPKYLWCNSKPNIHITNQGLNKKLKRLVEKANIKTYGKRIKFHCIRKFTFSRLRRVDRDMAKVICAKAVSSSDMTYEELNEQCEKVFRFAYKEISLNGDVTGKTKKEQSETIQKLEARIKELETFTRMLQDVYGEEIVQKALKRLNEGKLSKEQFDKLMQRFAKDH